MGEDGAELLERIEQTIREAAGGQKVVLIRLAVGSGLSISKVKLAAGLHRRFANASIELSGSKEEGAVTVKDIEVE